MPTDGPSPEIKASVRTPGAAEAPKSPDALKTTSSLPSVSEHPLVEGLEKAGGLTGVVRDLSKAEVGQPKEGVVDSEVVSPDDHPEAVGFLKAVKSGDPEAIGASSKGLSRVQKATMPGSVEDDKPLATAYDAGDDDDDLDIDGLLGGLGPAANGNGNPPSPNQPPPAAPPAQPGQPDQQPQGGQDRDEDNNPPPAAPPPPNQPPNQPPGPPAPPGEPGPDNHGHDNDPHGNGNHGHENGHGNGHGEHENHDPEHRLHDLRGERVEIIEKAERRTLERMREESQRPEVVEAAKNEARAAMEARNQKRVERERKRAQDEGRPFNEEDVVKEIFDEEHFEVPIPGKVNFDREYNGLDFEPGQKERLLEVDVELDNFAREHERTIEYLASKERGREIAEEIIHWEGLIKSGRGDEVNRVRYERAYRDQLIFMEASRLLGLKNEPAEDEDKPGEGSDGSENLIKNIGQEFKERVGDVLPLATIIQMAENPLSINNQNRDQFNEAVRLYLEEADRIGLLKELKVALGSAYQEVVKGIKRGLSSGEIMHGSRRKYIEGIENDIEIGLIAAVEVAKSKAFEDGDIANLFSYRQRRVREEQEDGTVQVVTEVVPDTDARGREKGVWDLYVALAKGRFYQAIATKDDEGINQRTYLGQEVQENGEREWRGEFRLDTPMPTQERYWGLSPSGFYIEIYAQTPEEYLIAADTFISDVQSRTSDPQEIFGEVNEFIKIVDRSKGHQSQEFRRILAKELGKEVASDGDIGGFKKGIITLLQARLGAFGGDHSNELYHGSQYKQFMDFMAKDGEGPSRWLALLQIDGVAEALWKMDNDPRFQMLFETYGSNGQLASDAEAQKAGGFRGLHNQVEHILVEEILGTRIRNRKNRTKDQLVDGKTDDEFLGLFDGMYKFGEEPMGGFNGDGNVKLYRKYGDSEEGKRYPSKLPVELRDAWRLGKIQTALLPVAKGGLGRTHHDLSASDQAFFEQAEAKAEKAVHIAMEIYGCLGEKSKRGGGVVKVRREYIDGSGNRREYFDFVPIHQGEKLVQFAEATAEMKYTDEYLEGYLNTLKLRRNSNQQILDPIAQRIIASNIADRVDPWVNFKARYRAGMVALHRDKALDEFAGLEYEVMEDSDGYVKTSAQRAGNHGGEEYIHNGGFVLRKLRDNEKNPVVRKGKNIVRLGGKGLDSKLYEYQYVEERGSGGKPVVKLVASTLRINRPLEGRDPEDGQKGSLRQGDLLGYSQNGQEIRLGFGADGKLAVPDSAYDPNTKRLVVFDKPNGDGRVRINDHIKLDTRFELKGNTVVEKAPVDFYLATHHFLGDWTSHTYWAYQEEDRQIIFKPETFSEARRIREGTLAAEKASPWARQLLMIDPTLNRVIRFPGGKVEDWERKLAMAAVEHKYQSHWRISREVHRAFFPTFATPVRFNGLYYGLQDFGGYRKMLESMRAQIGEDEERFARRARRLTPDLHVPYAAASEMWGVGTQGVLGVLKLMNLPIYKGVGTMALDKFSAQSEVANKMRSALVETRTGDGGYEESVLLKPTNNSDQLTSGQEHAIKMILPKDFVGRQLTLADVISAWDWALGRSKSPDEAQKMQYEFAYAVIKSLGRYEKYMKLFPLTSPFNQYITSAMQCPAY